MKHLLRLFILILVVGILITCKKENQPPTIQSTTANPQTIKTGETTQLTCTATDPDGDQLIYSWSTLNGTFPNGTSGSSISWIAPDEPGNYNFTVIVNDGELTENGSVTVIVEADPLLTALPTELDFRTEDIEKTIEVTNSGTGSLSWSLTENIEWLTVDVQSGEVSSETDQVTLTINREGMDPGEYTEEITISSEAGNKTVSITMEVPEETEESSGVFTDSRDGNTYNWVEIGEQIWMAENLAYLPGVSPPSEESYTDPINYVYDYNGTNVNEAKATSNYATYGVLYNWTAALTACPSGWHLPTDSEWTELTDYLGGESVAGGKLKETGITHWASPNDGATNETDFSALPGGYRYNTGYFFSVGYGGNWWSSTEYGTDEAWYRLMGYANSYAHRYRSNDKGHGYSVRCVRD